MQQPATLRRSVMSWPALYLAAIFVVENSSGEGVAMAILSILFFFFDGLRLCGLRFDDCHPARLWWFSAGRGWQIDLHLNDTPF